MTPEMLVMNAPTDHLTPPHNIGWDDTEEICAFCCGTGTVRLAVDELESCLCCDGTGFPGPDPWGYGESWPECGF